MPQIESFRLSVSRPQCPCCRWLPIPFRRTRSRGHGQTLQTFEARTRSSVLDALYALRAFKGAWEHRQRDLGGTE
jgi:hypothetical protein